VSRSRHDHAHPQEALRRRVWQNTVREAHAPVGLSVATVKKHTIHIFEKLGVESRTAAMLRAVEALA
jgi:hypothetical protein